MQGQWRLQYSAPHPAGGFPARLSLGVQGRSPAGGLGVSPNKPYLLARSLQAFQVRVLTTGSCSIALAAATSPGVR